MFTRPALAPHAAILYREPGTVQLGIDPQTGIVLSGLTEPELTLLSMLDGSRDVGSLRRWARRMRADQTRVSELLEQLAARGLLREGAMAVGQLGSDPEADIGPSVAALAEAQAVRLRHQLPAYSSDLVRQRNCREVLVDGHGNLADTIAATLRSSGFGRVRAGAWAAADRDLRRRTAPDGKAQSEAPDLVVLVSMDAFDGGQAQAWRGRTTTYLPVVTNGVTVEIGPLLGGDGPCARCLDLHRADRDPAWPELLAQLTAPHAGEPRAAVVSSAVAALAAGAAATLCADYLDLQRMQPGLAFEARPQAPYLLRRRWPLHPRCACHAVTVTMSA